MAVKSQLGDIFHVRSNCLSDDLQMSRVMYDSSPSSHRPLFPHIIINVSFANSAGILLG
jgi:hypothetical protein